MPRQSYGMEGNIRLVLCWNWSQTFLGGVTASSRHVRNWEVQANFCAQLAPDTGTPDHARHSVPAHSPMQSLFCTSPIGFGISSQTADTPRYQNTNLFSFQTLAPFHIILFIPFFSYHPFPQQSSTLSVFLGPVVLVGSKVTNVKAFFQPSEYKR